MVMIYKSDVVKWSYASIQVEHLGLPVPLYHKTQQCEIQGLTYQIIAWNSIVSANAWDIVNGEFEVLEFEEPIVFSPLM